jgi:transcriptional regulator with XRE-family HTH domain
MTTDERRGTSFAENLSRLRKERGVNQRKAAAELGISQALLSHYENGIREPGLDFVSRACEYYGVSADFMLGRTSLRETFLPGTGDGAAPWEKSAHDAAVLAAALMRLIIQSGDELAQSALQCLITAEYKFMRSLLAGAEADVFSLSAEQARALADAELQISSLKLSEEQRSSEIRPSVELLKKSVTKNTWKLIELTAARIEERLSALMKPKTDLKQSPQNIQR